MSRINQSIKSQMYDIRFIERLCTSYTSYTFTCDNIEYIHSLKPYECFQMFNSIPVEKLNETKFITDTSLNVFIDDVMNAFANQLNRQVHFLEAMYCLLIPHNLDVLYDKLDILRTTYNISDSIISLLLGRVLKVHGCIDERLILYFTQLNIDEIPCDTFNFVSKEVPLILLTYIRVLSKNEKPKYQLLNIKLLNQFEN